MKALCNRFMTADERSCGSASMDRAGSNRLDDELNVPIALGCGDKRLELTLLIACSFNQYPCVVAKVGKLFGREPEGHP